MLYLLNPKKGLLSQYLNETINLNSALINLNNDTSDKKLPARFMIKYNLFKEIY